MRAGVIRNPRAHANRMTGGAPSDRPPDVAWAEPETPQALAADLASFAAQGVDLLVVDGGDGTLREVLTALPGAFATPPLLAVLPSGKTNILALDLGTPHGWTLEAALAAADRGRTKSRTPLEAVWLGGGQADVRGFIFGLGAFERATRMSHAVNRMGAYHALSVGLTLAGAVLRTLFGGDRNDWRRGVEASVGLDGASARAGARFLVLATTLKRLPFGIAPFGPARDGLKLLDIDAPPRRLLAALPAVLSGRDAPWLERCGYRRGEGAVIAVSSPAPVVIDGEAYPGGKIVVRRGTPVRFLAP